METDRQVFAAQCEAIALHIIEHVVISVTQEAIFGNEAEVLVQFDRNTRS